MNSFKKTLTIKILVPLGALLVIAAGVLWAGADISDKTAHINAVRDDLNKRLIAINQFSALKASEQEAKPHVQKLSAALPNEDALLNAKSDIENVARHYNLSGSLQFVGSKKSVANGLMVTNFQIPLQGDSQGIKNFMNDVGGLVYIMNLLDVDVVGASANQYNAVINGQIYFNG